MDAKKCDICNKFYMDYRDENLGNFNGLCLFTYRDYVDFNRKTYDLCPNCMAAVLKLLDDLTERSEDIESYKM